MLKKRVKMKDQSELKRRLRNQWNRQLYRWWDSYNREYLSEALRKPLIRIGEGEQPLGSWNPVRRTLTLSQAHILGDPWPSVMNTLRHEMAHQYVDEVLKPVDEGPHGPAFQEACRRACDVFPDRIQPGARRSNRRRKGSSEYSPRSSL